MLLKKSIWNVSAITPLLLSFSTITYAASNLQALPDELLSPNLLPSISSMSLYNQAKIESNNFQSNFFASFNWSPGASDSNWFNPNNWIPNTLPGPADDVFISIATEFNPVIAGGGIATVNSVTVDGPGSFLTGIPSLLVRDNGVLNSNVIAIGQSFIGIMEISNGGLVTADVVNIGGANSSPGFTGSGIVVVTDAGSKLSANQIYIGNSGNGALTIINGAVVQDNRAFIAEEVGSAGTVTVSGANSQWNNTSYIRVGNRGNGNLSILDGGSVTVSDAIIGNNQSSVGSVNVSGATPFGASTLTSQTYIAVGSFGNGTLNISNGGLVYSVDGVIGANSGGTGVVNVENTGGWGISNTLFIGYSGNGTLTINPGGTVNTSTTYIGLNTGSIGALNLNGELFQNGTLITGQLVGGLGNKLANFNGGTLVASASTPNFIINFNPGELNLQNTDNFLVNSLTINSNGFDIGTSNAVFSGTGGLAKVGAGTLTLTGNHSYTGQTLVASGGLIVDGNLQSPVYVGTSFSAFGDTYLGGTGTVGATTVAGKIAPGHPTDSIATTLTVNGDYTQLGGSIYAVNVNTNQADLISIAGTATLNPNSAVQLFPLNPIIGNYTILHANQGLSGTYSNPILPNFLPFLNFTLSYTPQDVILNITRSGTLFASFARTRNQASVAQALESLAPAHNLAPPHSLHTAFVQLSHPTEIQNALDDLSGELYASTLAARVEESRYIRDAILNRLDDSETLAQVKTATGTVFWAHGFGAWGQLEGDGNAAKFERATQGFFIGADQAVGINSRLGLVGGFSESQHEVNNVNSHSHESSNGHLGLYGTSFFNQFVLSGGAAYSWSEIKNDTHRLVDFSTLVNRLTNHYNGHTAQVFGELGYNWQVNRFLVKPLINLAYVDTHTDSFTESGGEASLRARSASQDVFFSTLGARERGLISTTETYSFNQHLFLGWRHAYNHLTPYATFNFLPSSSPFLIAGTPIAEDALLIDAGLEAVRLTNNVHLAVSYFGQYSSQVKDNGVAARLLWSFS